MTDLRKEADAYWQDDLAKFFPTSKGPTTTEYYMFEAGFRRGLEMAAEIVESQMVPIHGSSVPGTAFTKQIRALLEHK